ncbi:hypothetical protein PINS_up011894 [Pythium insidiosum]|nr:hypothetical protein PINS_up011894 [Pythium insidiosum]
MALGQALRRSIAGMTTTVLPEAAVGAEEKFRKVFVNNDVENERLRREGHYASNRVSTSKYTLVR